MKTKTMIRWLPVVLLVLLLALPARAQAPERTPVDRSQNGRYEIDCAGEGREWSVRDTVSGQAVELPPGDMHTNYVFFGDLVARHDAVETRAHWGLFDPRTGEKAEIEFEPASPGRHVSITGSRSVFDHTLGLGWHAESQRFVRLTINREGEQFAGRLWLDFYDTGGSLVKSVETPFAQGFYPYYNEYRPEYNNLHIWGDYALFYHFPGTRSAYGGNEEQVVFFNLNDGTYWFAQADMWRAARERIVLVGYERDDAGNVQALRAEVYVDGECVDALWHPYTDEFAGNVIAYSYPEHKLFFNSLVFDFANGEVTGDKPRTD